MFVRCAGVESGFEWRAHTARWRWLILGALGVAPLGCGGRSDDPERNTLDENVQGGGAGARPSTPGRAGGGSGGGPVLSVGGSAGSSGGGASRTPSACEPQLTDLGGGWGRCANGMIHRAFLESCESVLPREPPAREYPDPARVDAGTFPGACNQDSDCTERAYGHCEWDPYFPETRLCQYGCVTNADCGDGSACFCGYPVGTCRAATCSVDADCGDGFLCSDYVTDPGCGEQAFACQQAADACAADSDCPQDQYCVRGNYPNPVPPGAPSFCSPLQCIVGRPFLVAGAERLASAVGRGDWYSARDGGARRASLVTESADGLDGSEDGLELRAAVRAGWLEQGLMEHASVAAFARFSLQLLALGAPAELCARSARAMQDEIEHARACFELARRHSDADVGPGPLDLAGAFAAADLEAIVLGTIAEGCIGETVAALEAAEALAHCTDEAARTVLARIERDETEHAELAWRFVAWALEVGPAGLRERVREAFADATGAWAIAAGAGLVERVSAAASAREIQLARQGLIAPRLRAELRSRVLREVMEPCARALVERDAPRSPAEPIAMDHRDERASRLLG